ncbi:MAG: DUF1559 domain-containing protein, partial [Planctomycetales bacterium]|nr:DUF1559 domain-containing protein [Planctomycetales bacterium]
QSAREAARRAQCRDHLRQTALATLQFAEAHDGRLPALWRTDREFAWENFSWRCDVLPFLEQTDLQRRIDWESLPLEGQNLVVAQTQTPTFICPSAPDNPREIDILGGPIVNAAAMRLAATDYVAVHDVSVAETTAPLLGAWGQAMIESDLDMAPSPAINVDRKNPFVRTLAGRLPAITDGLSRTALLVEQAGKPRHYTPALSEDESVPSEGAWATAEVASFYAEGLNADNFTGVFAFHHGAHVALGDGSVHLLSASVSGEVLAAILSREGDEILDSNDWD